MCFLGTWMERTAWVTLITSSSIECQGNGRAGTQRRSPSKLSENTIFIMFLVFLKSGFVVPVSRLPYSFISSSSRDFRYGVGQHWSDTTNVRTFVQGSKTFFSISNKSKKIAKPENAFRFNKGDAFRILMKK